MIMKSQFMKYTKHLLQTIKNFTESSKSSFVGIFYLVFFWLVYFRSIFTEKSSFFIFFDNVEQFYPWYQKINFAIQNGYIPLWDNNVLGGHSFVGEFQSGAMYLPNILLSLIFGNSDGISLIYIELLVALHFLWMSMGMFFLLKRYKFGNIASITGSIVFSYFGTTIARAPAQTSIFYGLTYIPWVLLTTHLFFEKKSKKYLVITGVLLASQIYSGHIQPFFHASLMVASYSLYKFIISLESKFDFKTILNKLKNYTFSMLLVFTTALFLSFPQLYLSLQYLSNAYRWYGPGSVGPDDKIPYGVFGYLYNVELGGIFNLIDWRIFVDDGNILYIGIVFFTLLLFGIYFIFKKDLGKNKEVDFWFLASIIALLISLGHRSFLTAIIYVLPLLDKVRQTGRYIIIFHFAISVIIAYALYNLQSRSFKIQNKYKLILLAIAGYIFLNAIFMRFVIEKGAISNFELYQWIAVSIIILAISAIEKFKKYALLTIFITVTATSLMSESLFVYKINARSTYPDAYFASNEAIEFLLSQTQKEQFRIYNYENALPRNIGDVYDIQTILGHGATMYKPYFDFLMSDISFDSDKLNLLNVKYIVSKNELDDDSVKLVLRDNKKNIFVYERNNYFPRVFSLNYLENQTEDEISEIKLLEYSDHHIKYDIQMKNPGQVIFSEVYYPGWHAYVNGKKQEILPFEILRSLNLEEGDNLVEFRYQPFKFF
ncbi:MAG: membrane protein [Candidatus Dojkabacteria bacterium]|nr:MAG: membrane protein [Candidatus Dojkabacteria bacterium]